MPELKTIFTDKNTLILEIVFAAIHRLWLLVRDLKSGALDPDTIDLAELRTRIDAIGDLPEKQ